MIDHAVTVLVWTAFFQAAAFVGRYALTAWWRSDMGWHIMCFMIAVVALLGLGVAREAFGAEWTGRSGVRLVAYMVINFLISWRLWMLVKAQRNRNDKEAP